MSIRVPTDLLSYVGSSFGETAWHPITQAEVELFADATHDHQWIHTDPARAASGPFGRTVVHGFLTLALIPKFLAELVVIEQIEAVVNYGLNKVRFPAPVPVGSQVQASITLADAKQKPAGVEATFAVSIAVRDTDRPACVAEAVVLYR
ncbi:MaoC family dehydratase [Tenggerimyces flavus]|uniref:MaoC family dehydratase n=1 Tax=Tenggerimyces flavus TaxID=1708749 RepID=A0ABV7YFK3_9ACTN|nr:MaoC family dehydratase [Tenggerimyces flavus]MBM7789328.1 acyl dehydratase [Tenggerimyces flavus]